MNDWSVYFVKIRPLLNDLQDALHKEDYAQANELTKQIDDNLSGIQIIIDSKTPA